MNENGRQRARLGATLTAAVLGIIGAVLLGAAVLKQGPAPPSLPLSVSPSAGERTGGPVSPSTPEPTDTGSTQPRPETGRVLPESVPVNITIPKLNVFADIIELGLNADGTMEVPSDPAEVGWYVDSRAPGGLGSSVLAGHVTWDQKPVVFFRLGELRRGDQVEVTREDGLTAVFEVRRIAQFPKTDFPTKAVYGPSEHAGLRLITCAGTYDEDANRYLDNIVVWATMVGSHKA